LGSVEIATIAIKVNIKKMKIHFNHKSGRSQKMVANRYKTSYLLKKVLGYQILQKTVETADDGTPNERSKT
jgi:hypothetical protein